MAAEIWNKPFDLPFKLEKGDDWQAIFKDFLTALRSCNLKWVVGQLRPLYQQ